MTYKILVTEEFERDFKKCDGNIRKQIQKEINQLKENPYSGKPLRYKFFREKKIQNHRFYYLIYEEFVIVYVLALSTKKDQQIVIDRIKKLLYYYQEEIRKKHKD